MNQKRIWLFGISALAGASAMSVDDVAAAWSRHTASICMPTVHEDDPYEWNGFDGKIWNDSDDLRSYYCPVVDTDVHRHGDVEELKVHVYDGNDNPAQNYNVVRAIACVTYYASQGGSCDYSVVTSGPGTGMYTLNPPVDKWSDYSSSFPYVLVALPEVDSNRRSMLAGVVTEY